MLTTIKTYEAFLVYYFNLCLSTPSMQEGIKFWSLEYARLDHDLKTYPEYFAAGNYLVSDKLQDCFLTWWRDKEKIEKKLELH